LDSSILRNNYLAVYIQDAKAAEPLTQRRKAMPGISKGSTIKILLAENKCYAFSLSLSGTASALGTLAEIL
jgi:hypothetical protein